MEGDVVEAAEDSVGVGLDRRRKLKLREEKKVLDVALGHVVQDPWT